MYVEYLIVGCICEDFDYIFCMFINFGMCVCCKGKVVNFVGDIEFFEFFFSFVNCSNFWGCVNNVWYDIVIDMISLICNYFCCGIGFIFCFVCKYRFMGYIVDCINFVDICFKVIG